MDFKILNIKVHNALDKLRQKDSDLIKIDVNERTLSHKLAEYLQEEFSDSSVDCEYNRHGGARKELDIPKDPVLWDDIEAKTVFPDIIVHKRNTDANNLLVIEMKKSSNRTDRQFDMTKIMALSKKPYNYKFGLFIELNMCGTEDILRWYVDERWFQYDENSHDFA